MQLDALIPHSWHAQLWQRIDNAQKLNRLPHALLLWGQRGLGKKNFANLLAKKLLCLAPTKPCNLCQGCNWFSKGIHPDFTSLLPESGKKNINVEQIRQLQIKLASTRTQMQTPRVIIIYEAQVMNIAANNALLKSLEEPIDHVVYILVAPRLSTIPPTILSRTQKIYFPPLKVKELEDYLESQKIKLDNASLLGGAPLLVSEYLSDEKLQQRRSILNSLQNLILKQASACQISAKWSKFDEQYVLEVLFSWFSDLIKMHNGAVDNDLINKNNLLELKNNLKIMQLSKLFTIIDKLVNFTSQVSFARQINTALWFDDLAILIFGEIYH